MKRIETKLLNRKELSSIYSRSHWFPNPFNLLQAVNTPAFATWGIERRDETSNFSNQVLRSYVHMQS